MKRITDDLQGVCGIYKIINLINNKFYIGSSKNLKVRLWKHRSLLRHNKHYNLHLQNSWNKYGEDNFDYCIVETCDEEHQYEREQFYINTLHPEYNIAEKVELPSFSEESRKKQSETRKRMFKEGLLTPTRMTKVFMYDLNGNFIKEFPSEKSAAEELGVDKSQIEKNLTGENKRCHNYIFTYEYFTSIPPYRRTKNVENQYKTVHVYNNSEDYYFKNAKECSAFFNVHIVYVRDAIKHNRMFKRKYMIEYKNCSAVE